MFVNWAQQQLKNDSVFVENFWLNGFVNKQNMHCWSDSNPQVLHEASLYSEKLRFGAVYGPAASLGRIIKTGMLL